ncbi:MAG: hypothetical protein KY452_08705, partial [Actinobacteria bacterium]|nr:hypothetical protein [Actinomycetota bacterium]
RGGIEVRGSADARGEVTQRTTDGRYAFVRVKVELDVTLEPAPPAALYTPPRPIPATLPGGACESVFGPGAGSAVQADHRLAAPDGRVIRPENDRQLAAAAPGAVGTAGPEALAVDDGAAPVQAALPTSTHREVDPPLLTVLALAVVGLLIVTSRILRRRVRAGGSSRRGRGASDG